jgi:outer membrane autotransporter protein
MNGAGILTLTDTVNINTLNVNTGLVNCNGTTTATVLSSVASGAIFSGAGTLTSASTSNSGTVQGTVTINGPVTNNMTGLITGSTTINGNLTNNGTLAGNAAVFGTVQNNNILSPGMSIGTINVTDMNFNNGSFYDVEIQSTQSDLLNASHNVTINSGSTLNITVDPGTYSIGETYTVINASNALVKNAPLGFTIGTVTSGYTFQTLYTSNLLQLILLGAPFGSRVPPGGNSGSTAIAFNTLSLSNPDVANLINFLNFATNAQLQCDFDSMNPAPTTAISIAQEATTTAVRKTLTDRLQEIHGAHCGFRYCEKRQAPVSEHEVPSDEECKALPSEEHHVASTSDKIYNIWLTPLGNFTKQKSRSQRGICDSSKIGFNSNTWGTTLAFDAKAADYCVVGGAVSYAHTDLDWKKSIGHSQTNSVFASLFGTLYNSLAYLDLAVMGAYDHFTAQRRITLVNQFATMHRTAKHKNNAGEYDLYAGFGYTLNKGNWQFNPYATVDFMHLYQQKYKESGAESIDLKVKMKNYNLLRNEFGVSFSSCQRNQSNWAFTERIKLGYVHEARFRGRKITAEFVGPPDSSLFVVRGFWPNRDLFALGVSLQVIFPDDHFSIDLGYDGEFGDRWSNQTGNLELLYTF